jgi:hypothetical protein
LKTISGKWQFENGLPVAGGLLKLQLIQDAGTVNTTSLISPTAVNILLDSTGSIPANTSVWFNDELTPSGTTYTVTVVNQFGGIVWGPETVQLTGASFNFNTFTPTGVPNLIVLPNAVYINPPGSQSVIQPVGTSLNVNRFENIRFADQFAGADLGAKINAADADLGLKGGEIWINRNAGTTISTAVSLRNNLRFIEMGTWNVSATITIAHGGIGIFGMGLNDSAGNPGTLLQWTGAAGQDMISIIGQANSRIDVVTITDMILDGLGGRYTLRSEKVDDARLVNVRLRNGGTASFYAIDATGWKWINVQLSQVPAYGAVFDWGTGGFEWAGGNIDVLVANSNPVVYLQGAINSWHAHNIEMDASQVGSFAGFVALSGFDTSSGFASSVSGGAGAPQSITFNDCSVFMHTGANAPSQGAEFLISGTPSNHSNKIVISEVQFNGLSISQAAVKVDLADNVTLQHCQSSGHTVSTLIHTGAGSFESLIMTLSTDPVRVTGAGSGLQMDLNQGPAGRFAVGNINTIRYVDGVKFTTLQQAINDLPAEGGTVILPGGVYAQNTPVNLRSNVTILGAGSAAVDNVTGPTTITTNLASGDLFYFNAINDCRMADLSIKASVSGVNSAIRLTAAQRNKFERIYIAGPFLNPVQLDSSSSAPASTIWNQFIDVHTTGTAAGGVGLLFDSKDANPKVINGNFFFNFRATGGVSGAAIKLTNSGVHNQVINENQIWASEAVATLGTCIQIDQGSTRGIVFHDVDAEGSFNGLNKATANTVTFIGGNISANSGTNVIDAQPSFTQFIGTNVGGIVQTFAITPVGGVYTDGVSVGGATPSTNVVALANGGVVKFSTDTGISRDSAGVLDFGNGTAGDTSAWCRLGNISMAGAGSGGSNSINAPNGWTILSSGSFKLQLNANDVTFGKQILVPRAKVNQGTAYTSGDTAIGLGAGFGSTRSVSNATGFDQALSFTVNATGTGQSANPTITVTFKDGTWTTAPQVLVIRNDLVTPFNTPPHTISVTATAITITFNGTPTAGNSYNYIVFVLGV